MDSGDEDARQEKKEGKRRFLHVVKENMQLVGMSEDEEGRGKMKTNNSTSNRKYRNNTNMDGCKQNPKENKTTLCLTF